MPAQAPSADPIAQTASPTVDHDSSSNSAHPPSNCPFSPSTRALHTHCPLSDPTQAFVGEIEHEMRPIFDSQVQTFTLRPLMVYTNENYRMTIVASSKRTANVVCTDDKRACCSSSPLSSLDLIRHPFNSHVLFSFREAGIRQRRIYSVPCLTAL